MESEETVEKKDFKVTPSLLDAFELLKQPPIHAKFDGALNILAHLQKKEDEKDTKYVVKRLVRSLGAQGPHLRMTFFSTLVTLLTISDEISVTQLLELIKKELHANGSSKSEVGAVSLGQILVCGAILRSKLMLKCTAEEQKEVIKVLVAASNKKSYLSVVGYPMLLDFVNGLDEELFSSVVWSNIKQEFQKDIKEHSLDTLYFLIVVSNKFPKIVKLRKLIGTTEILNEDNIHTVCEKIMSGIDFNSVKHPIYEEVGKIIADSTHLQLFWTSGIDSQLVKHNRNKELVAIKLLNTILNNMKENFQVIPELLSKNFFKLLMDWFKGLQTASKFRNKRNDEDDHKIMIKNGKEFLSSLTKTLKSEKVTCSVRLQVLEKLLLSPGEMNFSELTGIGIVKSTIADLDINGVKKMAKIFKDVLLNTSKKVVKEDVERSWYNNERVKAAELLSYLVTHSSVKDDSKFKLKYMKSLMCFGFFKIGGDDNISIGTEMSGAIKTSFYRCFTSRLTNVDSLVEILSVLSNYISSNLEKDQVRTKLEKQFPKENMDCWETLVKICQNIESCETKSKVEKVFLILLYQLGLFLFSEPTHVKLARSSIKELNSCYRHYKKGQKKKPNKVEDGDITEEEPEWIEVLVEVLLSILSAESSVLRYVVQCVFRLLLDYITPTNIEQIVSVLDPENESNPLSQDSDSESDDSDEEDNVTHGQKDNEESDESDSEAEDNDDDMKTPDQLRIAVQKALGAAADSDNESIDADMIDEEEGRKLDEALAEAFKQFHQGKGMKSKKDRKDKKALSDFRIRVLDLIDVYLDKEPSMDVCLSLIAPLIRCLEFAIQDSQFKDLENRLRRTLKELTTVRKFSSTSNVTSDMLYDCLKSNIEKGSRSHFLFQALGDVITNLAYFIIHCSQKLDTPHKTKKGVSPIIQFFKESTNNYFHNRNCLLPIIFFHKILSLPWEGNYEILSIVTESIFDSSVRQFRRKEGLELLLGFYRSIRGNNLYKQNPSKFLAFETGFENALKVVLRQDSEYSANVNFFKQLKKLITCMDDFHEKFICNIVSFKSDIDFKSILAILQSCKGTKKINNKQLPSVDNENDKNIQKKQKKKKRKNNQKNGHVESLPKKKRKNSENISE